LKSSGTKSPAPMVSAKKRDLAHNAKRKVERISSLKWSRKIRLRRRGGEDEVRGWERRSLESGRKKFFLTAIHGEKLGVATGAPEGIEAYISTSFQKRRAGPREKWYTGWPGGSVIKKRGKKSSVGRGAYYKHGLNPAGCDPCLKRDMAAVTQKGNVFSGVPKGGKENVGGFHAKTWCTGHS